MLVDAAMKEDSAPHRGAPAVGDESGRVQMICLFVEGYPRTFRGISPSMRPVVRVKRCSYDRDHHGRRSRSLTTTC